MMVLCLGGRADGMWVPVSRGMAYVVVRVPEPTAAVLTKESTRPDDVAAYDVAYTVHEFAASGRQFFLGTEMTAGLAASDAMERLMQGYGRRA